SDVGPGERGGGGEHGFDESGRADTVRTGGQALGRRPTDRCVGIGDEGGEAVAVALRVTGGQTGEAALLGRTLAGVAHEDARSVGGAEPRCLGVLLVEDRAARAAVEL